MSAGAFDDLSRDQFSPEESWYLRRMLAIALGWFAIILGLGLGLPLALAKSPAVQALLSTDFAWVLVTWPAWALPL